MVVSCDAQCLNDQIFEESSTYCGTLKAAACTIVTTRYNLHNAKFDEDRFSNQQGWWEYLKSMACELIDNCTFLHQGEDNEVSVKTCATGDTDSNCYRVCQTILIIWHSKNFAYLSTTLVPKQLGTCSPMNCESLPFNAISLVAAAVHSLIYRYVWLNLTGFIAPLCTCGSSGQCQMCPFLSTPIL